jgi:molybdenum cofactor synthesis domain-containing protein
MASAAIVSVGRELLRGRTLDTNAHFLAQRLTALGFEVRRLVTADDAPDSVSEALRFALAGEPRIVVTTGGLGPTFDDRTFEGIALAAGVATRTDERALALVTEAYHEFAARGLVASAAITPERAKMAALPEGARPIPNPEGAAPAVEMRIGKTAVFALPGVPDEMRAVWEREVEPAIARLPGLQRAGEATADVTLETKDESSLAPILEELRREYPAIYPKSRVSGAGEGVRIVVTFSTSAGPGASDLLEAASRRLRERVAERGLRSR